jgi:V/A-type H+-transporting ATPase subunit A
MKDRIYSINGPVITVKDTASFQMLEMVYVGNLRLIGEVISITRDRTTIQVYEDTAGIRVGEPVEGSGAPLCVLLGPGIISNIFDGIERPLQALRAGSGDFMFKGVSTENLDIERKWPVTFTAKVGDVLKAGETFATVPETERITHRCMVPPNQGGKVVEVQPNGDYAILEPVLTLEDEKGNRTQLTLAQRWPIKYGRPYQERLEANIPLITGQRIIDSMFPIAKGGAAAIPGGFGTGKTMTQHQIAKWSDADIIVYIGCGERGNEMTQVLEEFGELIDPRTGKKLTDRTVLIANTSNMPVAAREASIYTGITLAEYYRDMGYHVAIMADSTSRWAEALREISGRLEEMPAEEGFPAYLPSRLSQFYERAGICKALGGKTGSVTIIGAVSPQGGDFSEPVTQNTKRFIRCFWALDRSLAYSRHYPAINWITSYTEYYDDLAGWYSENVDPAFGALRGRVMNLLLEEDRLNEIVKLIGQDVLPDDQRLILQIARMIREGFLQQNAYHAVDTYVPIVKQYKMMELILYYYDEALKVVRQSIPISRVEALGHYELITKAKYEIPNDQLQQFETLKEQISRQLNELAKQYH